LADEKKHGWFTLSRSLLHNKLWLSDRFTKGQAWIDLIGLAMFRKGEINVRGSQVAIERGQVGYSQEELGRRWKWSRNKVKRFLNYLENEHQIEQHNEHVNKYLKTVITITNYDHYQEGEHLETQLNTRQTDGRQTADDTVYNKEDNEDKENKVINAPKSSSRKRQKPKPVQDNPPSFKETLAYCDEQDFFPEFINPKELWDFYFLDKEESQRWTYKDGKPVMNWKSLYRNIHNSNKKLNKVVGLTNTSNIRDGSNSLTALQDGTRAVPIHLQPKRVGHPDDPIQRNEDFAPVEQVVFADDDSVYVRRGQKWFDAVDNLVHPTLYGNEGHSQYNCIKRVGANT
jgi:hypothetical protein